ncbi:MAG: ATP-binding protein, partial [Nitrospiraceae bacterium]
MNDSLVNVEQPAMKQAAFDMYDLLDRVMGVMAVTAHRNGLELVCHMSADVPVKVLGDPHDLRKVVFHLVEHAVKSAETGEVVLRITQDHAEEEACVLRFSVSQTGTGISADKVESSRGHSDAAAGTIEKSGGATPAFTRAKPLVERMGGRIWIDRSD